MGRSEEQPLPCSQMPFSDHHTVAHSPLFEISTLSHISESRSQQSYLNTLIFKFILPSFSLVLIEVIQFLLTVTYVFEEHYMNQKN